MRAQRRTPKKQRILEFVIQTQPLFLKPGEKFSADKTPVLKKNIRHAETRGMHIEYVGVDPKNSPPGSTQKFETGGRVIEKYAIGRLGLQLNLRPNSVDEIHLHMIDTHVEDLEETCKQLVLALKSEGKIFITGDKGRKSTKYCPFGLNLPQALEILSKHFRITQFFTFPEGKTGSRIPIKTPQSVKILDTGKGIIEGTSSPLQEWELTSVSARHKFLKRFTNYYDMAHYFLVLEPRGQEPRTVKGRILNPALLKPGTKQMNRKSIGIIWPKSGHGDRQPKYGGDGKGEYQQFRIRRTALSKEEKRKIIEREEKQRKEEENNSYRSN